MPAPIVFYLVRLHQLPFNLGVITYGPRNNQNNSVAKAK